MTEQEKEIYDIVDYTGYKRQEGPREIMVTPFEGEYDHETGFVIAVKGSPPRGFIFYMHMNGGTLIVYPNGGASKVKKFESWNQRHKPTILKVKEFLKSRGFGEHSFGRMSGEAQVGGHFDV